MSEKFPGGFIIKTPTAPTGSAATGIWTLDQVTQYKQAGQWPSPPIAAGQLWGWGSHSYGTLGNASGNRYSDTNSPILVSTATNWIVQNGVVGYCVGVRSDNTMTGWGNGSYGQAGNGYYNNNNYNPNVQVSGGAVWATASRVQKSAAAVRTNGTLWTWGRNNKGQGGRGSTGGNTGNTPQQVGALTNWSTSANKIVMGCYNVAAIKTDGTLWTWGFNIAGSLGNNSTSDTNSPAQVGALTNWAQVSMSNQTLAVKTDGTLWAWGVNNNGQLAQNNTIYRSSPVQVGNDTNWAFAACSLFGVTLSSSAVNSAMFGIRTDGTLWSWGGNNYSSGGTARARASSPIQVGLLTNWSKIVTSAYTTIALKADGTIWAWGLNNFGQCGIGNNSNVTSPTQIGALTGWGAVGLGKGAGTGFGIR